MRKLYVEDHKIAYYADENGNIFSLWKRTGKWKALKPRRGTNGYTQFSCSCHRGKPMNVSIHRAVWEAFNGPIPPGKEINHINTIRDDNRLVNLELVTSKQNHLHPPTRQKAKESSRKRMLPVEDVTTGKVFESAHAAERATNIARANIVRCCNGIYSQANGHVFCWK